MPGWDLDDRASRHVAFGLSAVLVASAAASVTFMWRAYTDVPPWYQAGTVFVMGSPKSGVIGPIGSGGVVSNIWINPNVFCTVDVL